MKIPEKKPVTMHVSVSLAESILNQMSIWIMNPYKIIITLII